jgi:hypothetical protein
MVFRQPYDRRMVAGGIDHERTSDNLRRIAGGTQNDQEGKSKETQGYSKHGITSIVLY